MKKLNEYVALLEAQTRDNVRIGAPANRNGSGGKFAIDEPVDDDVIDDDFIDKQNMNMNIKRLYSKFQAEEDFFILGRAGWGKTSIIKKLARQFKRIPVTVYLDKCEASDLGGIPAPAMTKRRRGNSEQEIGKQIMLMPGWAAYMYENPDKDFLLFLDEMNQADPAVLNTLMPIVLEHEVCGVGFDNFFVGAAGNYHDENDALFDMSKPLESRFKPLIEWECDWDAAFAYLHKEWDEKIGEEFVSRLDSCRELFNNPREVEHKIIKFIVKIKSTGDYEMYDSDLLYDRLARISKDELSRSEQNQLKELADFEVEWLNNKVSTVGRRRSGKDISMVDKVTLDTIKQGMTLGYLTDDKGLHVGLSRESLYDAMDPNEVNRDMFERIVAKFENDGVKFKYETDADWQKVHKDWITIAETNKE